MTWSYSIKTITQVSYFNFGTKCIADLLKITFLLQDRLQTSVKKEKYIQISELVQTKDIIRFYNIFRLILIEYV